MLSREVDDRPSSRFRARARQNLSFRLNPFILKIYNEYDFIECIKRFLVLKFEGETKFMKSWQLNPLIVSVYKFYTKPTKSYF